MLESEFIEEMIIICLDIRILLAPLHSPEPSEPIREGVSVETLWRHLPLDSSRTVQGAIERGRD